MSRVRSYKADRDSFILLWVAANAKKIPIQDFERAAKCSFDKFFLYNKKDCLRAWREYCRERMMIARAKSQTVKARRSTPRTEDKEG